MEKVISESEMQVLEILWAEGDTTAKELTCKLKESTDWDSTTTLQVIRKCSTKGLVKRTKTRFMYHATISREEAAKYRLGISESKRSDGNMTLSFA